MIRPEWWRDPTWDECRVVYTDMVGFAENGIWDNGPPQWCMDLAKFYHVSTGSSHVMYTAWEAIAKCAMRRLGEQDGKDIT